jgi:hypothetical protein
MKPAKSLPQASPVAESRRRTPDLQGSETAAESYSDEQAFYAAQEVAFADLRAYHASRPRRKR